LKPFETQTPDLFQFLLVFTDVVGVFSVVVGTGLGGILPLFAAAFVVIRNELKLNSERGQEKTRHEENRAENKLE
jgi:hypothetical protein